MTNPADYFFYRVFQWRLTCTPPDRMPLLTTKMALSIICFFNLLAILPWIKTSLELPHSIPIPALGILTVFVILGAVHFIWITSGRYRTLDEKFANETTSQRKRRTWMLYAYVALTICSAIISPLVAGILHVHRNGLIHSH
jgi:hypothetical protein